MGLRRRALAQPHERERDERGHVNDLFDEHHIHLGRAERLQVKSFPSAVSEFDADMWTEILDGAITSFS